MIEINLKNELIKFRIGDKVVLPASPVILVPGEDLSQMTMKVVGITGKQLHLREG